MPKLMLRTPLSDFTGYGTFGIILAREWSKLVELSLYPSQVTMGLPTEVLSILGQLEPPKPELIVDLVDPGSAEGKLGHLFSVLFTMWEQTKLIKDFDTTNLGTYDLIIVPNEENKKTFAEFIPAEKIQIIPLGVDTQFYEWRARNLNEPIKFCAVGNLSRRKGIELIVDAYQKVRAKHECSLTIRSTGAGIHPKWADIIKNLSIFCGPWSKQTLRSFYYNHDVMLALSRGEGFNMPAVEFLSTGGSVIATSFMGHAQWANSEYMYLVPHSLTPVKLGYKNLDKESLWGEPSFDAITEAMESCIKNQIGLKQKMLNTKVISKMFDITDISKRILEVVLSGYENYRSKM